LIDPVDVIAKLVAESFGYIAGLLSRILRKKLPKKSEKQYRLEVAKLIDEHFHGVLGDKLVKAYREYIASNNKSLLKEIKDAQLSSVLFVIEVSRPIVDDIRIRMEKEPDYVFSMIKTLNADEIREVALVIARLLRIINAIHDGPEIKLFLSTPLALAFMLGQIAGLSHYKVKVYQYMEGKYHEIREIKREELTGL